MEREQKILYVPKSLIDDPEITGFDLAVFIQTDLCSMRIFTEPFCLGIGTISYKLYGDPNKHKTEIQNAFKKLCEKYPDIFTATSNKKYIITDFNKKVDEYQVSINLIEYDSIINSEYTYKFNMLKAFLVILSTARSNIKVNGRGYLGTNFKYSWYGELCDCSSPTFSNYVTCLEKLDLVFVYHSKDKDKTNILGHKKNERCIIKWAVENDYDGRESNLSNKHRSLMAKFNYLSKQLEMGNSCPYTKVELKEIRKYIVEHNKYCKEQSKIDSSYLLKIKDVTIIDNIKQ